MKKLITLISTEGKSMEQVQEEAIAAMRKFRQVHSQSLAQESQQPLTTQQLIDQFNQEAEKQGNLLPDTEQDSVQIIMFRKKPVYPKKK